MNINASKYSWPRPYNIAIQSHSSAFTAPSQPKDKQRNEVSPAAPPPHFAPKLLYFLSICKYRYITYSFLC